MIHVIKMLIPIDIPQTFFTMSIVSFGNALPDIFNDCSLARTGFAEMAFSGAIGSPVFGILFGFGISLVKSCIIHSVIAFDIFDISSQSNKILLTALGCLMANMIRLLIEGFALKFKLTKGSAIVGYVIYVGYLISICYFAFG